MKINTDWLKAAGIRALKTVAQTAVATIGVSATMGDVDWVKVGSTALLAGILSLLTSVGGLPELEAKELPASDGKLVIDDSSPDLFGVAVNFGKQSIEDIVKKDHVVLDVAVENIPTAPAANEDYQALH